MNKEEKIEMLVSNWLAEMDLSALQELYVYIKTEELEHWSEEEIEKCLEVYKQFFLVVPSPLTGAFYLPPPSAEMMIVFYCEWGVFAEGEMP